MGRGERKGHDDSYCLKLKAKKGESDDFRNNRSPLPSQGHIPVRHEAHLPESAALRRAYGLQTKQGGGETYNNGCGRFRNRGEIGEIGASEGEDRKIDNEYWEQPDHWVHEEERATQAMINQYFILVE